MNSKPLTKIVLVGAFLAIASSPSPTLGSDIGILNSFSDPSLGQL